MTYVCRRWIFWGDETMVLPGQQPGRTVGGWAIVGNKASQLG